MSDTKLSASLKGLIFWNHSQNLYNGFKVTNFMPNFINTT